MELVEVYVPDVLVKGFSMLFDTYTEYLNTVLYKRISMTDCLIMVDPTITSLIASIASVIGVVIGAKIHSNTKPDTVAPTK